MSMWWYIVDMCWYVALAYSILSITAKLGLEYGFIGLMYMLAYI